MSIIDDDHKLDRSIESMTLDEYKLIDSPTKQLNDSLHEHIMGVRMALTLDTGITLGLAPREGS